MSPQPAQPNHADYYRQVLHELIDIGADLARILHAQAKAAVAAEAPGPAEPPSDALQPAPPPTPPLDTAFDRIARAVRRSIMLARALDAPPRPRPANDEAPTPIAARRRIVRAVEDAIQAAADNDRAEALRREAQDRLDAPDLDEDILSRPVNDIIAAICADLGLPPAPPGLRQRRPSPVDAARPARNPSAPPESLASTPAPTPAKTAPTPLLPAARFRGK